MPPRTHRAKQHIVNAHVAQAVSNSVVTVTPVANAEGLLLQAIDANIRYTLDDTDPVGGTTGFLLYDERDPLLVDIGDNAVFKFIRDDATDAELQYQQVRGLS